MQVKYSSNFISIVDAAFYSFKPLDAIPPQAYCVDMSKKNVSEFVQILGGNEEAASLFKVTAPAICNWKKVNRFPAWVLPQVYELAKKYRVEIAPRATQIKRPTGARPLAEAS